MHDDPVPTSVILAHTFGIQPVAPSVTVIIVVWRLDGNVERCIAGLVADPDRDFELIVVGNGVDPTASVSVFAKDIGGTVLGLDGNHGPSVARNAAAAKAIGPLLLFLDDDAVPAPGWVGAHRAAHEDESVQAVRGRVVADQSRFLTRLARSYDLGDEPRRAVLNTEGNASLKKGALIAVGGFAAMFGHEGVELTGRLVERYGPDAVRYSPAPVIRHDYVSSFGGYLAKRFRHGRMMRRLGFSEVRMAAAVRPRLTIWDLVMAPLRIAGAAAEFVGLLWPMKAGAERG